MPNLFRKGTLQEAGLHPKTNLALNRFQGGSRQGSRNPLKHLPKTNKLPTLNYGNASEHYLRDCVTQVYATQITARATGVKSPPTLTLMRATVPAHEVRVSDSRPNNVWYRPLDVPVEVAPETDEPTPKVFPKVYSITLKHSQDLFDSEWGSMELGDLIKNAKHLSELKKLFWDMGWWRPIRDVHNHFSCLTKQKVNHIGRMFAPDFVALCKASQLVDRVIHTTYLSVLFRRVNIEDERKKDEVIYDEDGQIINEVEWAPKILTNEKGEVYEDTVNLVLAFTRGELIEALIRLALKKFGKSKNDDNAFLKPVKRMMLDHVLKYAWPMSGGPTALSERERLWDDKELEYVWFDYCERIYRVYDAYARTDYIEAIHRGPIDMSAYELMLLCEEYGLVEGINMRYVCNIMGKSRDENFVLDSYIVRFHSFVEILIRLAVLKGPQNISRFDTEAPKSSKDKRWTAWAFRDICKTLCGPKKLRKTLVSVNWKAKSVPRWWTEDLGETSMAEDVYALKTVYMYVVERNMEPRTSDEPEVILSDVDDEQDN